MAVSPTKLGKVGKPVVESGSSFLLWAVEALGIGVEPAGEGQWWLEIPEPHRHSFAGADRLCFTVDSQQPPPAPSQRAGCSGATLWSWLLEQLQQPGKLLHGVPLNRSDSVHAITPALFDCYQVDGGHVVLGGCTLEDRPFLRLTYSAGRSAQMPPRQVLHCFVDQEHGPVELPLIRSLRMDRLAVMSRKPRELDATAVHKWVSAGQRIAAEQVNGDSSTLVAATLVWCRYAQGKLVFQIGKRSVELPFAGWAQLLADGQIKPPPYHCPRSDLRSYHLAADDEEEITVAEAIGTCEESGARVIETTLQRCELTGRRVCPQYLERCPVSGVRVARSQLAKCTMCGQLVSPATLRRGRCSACRALRRVGRDDPVRTALEQRYPGLRRWSRWAVSRSATVYIVLLRSGFRQLLVVADISTLDLRKLATKKVLARCWSDVPEEDQAACLS